LLNVGGNAITYTDASPTFAELLPKIADGASQSTAARKLPPTAVFVAPRRAFWIASSIDSSNRPVVEPSAAGAGPELLIPEGPFGNLALLPAFMDPSIPTNLGAGTNEDRVIVTRPSDFLLFEGAMRFRIVPQKKADTLEVLLQALRYVAFTAERYPTVTSVVSGTGLITPTF
jgi:hypothetical protein